jgi:Phage integrase family
MTCTGSSDHPRVRGRLRRYLRHHAIYRTILTERAVNYIVKAAAEAAGVNPAASVHWLRHAQASHAIDNGAPITLVSATLGDPDLKTTSVYATGREIGALPEARAERYRGAQLVTPCCSIGATDGPLTPLG